MYLLRDENYLKLERVLGDLTLIFMCGIYTYKTNNYSFPNYDGWESTLGI